MKPIPFEPATDIAPLPFDQAHLNLARDMKQGGLPWKPHVGCFVWDHDGQIEAKSPFPLQVYFILSLPRFIDIFGSTESVAEQLVWVPTWHQARRLADGFGVAAEAVAGLWTFETAASPGEELLGIYRLILQRLSMRSGG